VSTIQSRLSEHATMMDAVKAAFPPGSMTGAPKISAMQHIESLEPYKRSVYAGAIGWMQASGETMLSVVIRTLIFNGASGYFQTGGAIVWDSIPDEEYQECWDKAQGILRALEKLGVINLPVYK
ncbi:MAG TPA: chorismate-binding protein, partial [bacterium]|nr:chorismate-binding protein [bacterium]